MTITGLMRRAALGAALLATRGASIAYAHGVPDQANDPATGSYFWCNGRSGGLSQ
jgi:hypothetical protein